MLRPQGRLACLEITRPKGALEPFFRLWFDGLVPLIGKALPGGEAYTYLPASVRRFPGPENLATLLAQAGFTEIRWNLLGGGIVALHTATAGEQPVNAIATIRSAPGLEAYLQRLEARLETCCRRLPGPRRRGWRRRRSRPAASGCGRR